MWTFAFPSTSQPNVRAWPSLIAGVTVRAPLHWSHTGSPVSSLIIRGTLLDTADRYSNGVLSGKYSYVAGLSHGHGWFRTSDLSRVKRYLTPRENARFPCKTATCSSNARIRVLRSLRVFHGSSGHWSPPVAHSATRVCRVRSAPNSAGLASGLPTAMSAGSSGAVLARWAACWPRVAGSPDAEVLRAA
jgi:hypothetical protein